MKTEIELSLNIDPTDPLAKILGTLYYDERRRAFDHGMMICAHGIYRYTKLPKGTKKITICFYKTGVPDSFEIGRRIVKRPYYTLRTLSYIETALYCMIDHPKVQLLQSFRGTLYRYYINGYKFFRIEY